MKTPEEIEHRVIMTLQKYEESYAPWELDEMDCPPYTTERMVEFGKDIYQKAILDCSENKFTEGQIRSLVDSVMEFMSHNDPDEFDEWFEKKITKLKSLNK
jgi:hypothetical protein